MTKIKRSLTLLLCLVILVSLFPAAAFAEGEIVPAERTGWAVPLGEMPREDELDAVETTIDVPDIDPEDLTEEGVYAAMLAMKTDFPEGMPWTNDNFYAWYGGIFSRGYGCAGFVFLLSDAAFGKIPARMTAVDYEQLRVGDILRINHDTHSVIILEVHPEKVVIAEGNFNASIHWGRTLTRSEVEAADYALTRWPSTEEEQDPNTFQISVRIEPEVLRYDQEFVLTATVTDLEGKPVTGQEVCFAIMETNGRLVSTRPLNGHDYIIVNTMINGEATMSYSFARADGSIEPGNYLVFAKINETDRSAIAPFELLGDEPVSDRVPGDVTGDGKVDGKDLVRLRKYIAGADVEIVTENADVTGDGNINGKDLIRLRKYLAGEDVVLQ